MKDIYIIRNVINGKVYIGQTYNVDERWSRHVYDTKNHTTNMPLHEDMRIYGIDNFNYTVIEQCSDEVANEREQFWINYFNATGDNGYNVCIGGAGVGTGVNHPKARLNQEQLDLLVNDLKYSGLSNAKLAKKYNCSETTVQFINNGQAYYNPNLTYPLKKSNRYDKEKIKQIKYALKYELDKSINDIAKEFNVHVSQVHDMNQGKIHAFSNETYPLRSGLNKGIMSKENVNLVINSTIKYNLTIYIFKK
jgi:group I intron endonuclease